MKTCSCGKTHKIEDIMSLPEGVITEQAGVKQTDKAGHVWFNCSCNSTLVIKK